MSVCMYVCVFKSMSFIDEKMWYLVSESGLFHHDFHDSFIHNEQNLEASFGR